MFDIDVEFCTDEKDKVKCPPLWLEKTGDWVFLAIILSEAQSIGRAKVPASTFEITYQDIPVDQAVFCISIEDCEIFF